MMIMSSYYHCLLLLSFVIHAQCGRFYSGRMKRYCDACHCCSNPAPFVNYNPVENPCAYGQGLMTGSNTPLFCNWESKNACPMNYYCHVGMEVHTTTCCPTLGNVPSCSQPLLLGEGGFKLQRWYFDPVNQTCSTFSYHGLRGNANNFLTKLHCESSCLNKRDDTNPCLNGNPVTDTRSGQPWSCKDNVHGCPDYHYCHLGGTADVIVCCPMGNVPVCQLPVANGLGSLDLKRWYYDGPANICREFTYTGTKGNANNFANRESCLATCQSSKNENPCPRGSPLTGPDFRSVACSSSHHCPDTHWCHLGFTDNNVCCPLTGKICEQALASGEGSASLKRWYYNGQLRDCVPFEYKGSKGNANNFLSEADCRVSCPVWKNPCPSGDPVLLPDGSPQTCSGISKHCPTNYWCHMGSDIHSSLCCPNEQNPCQLPMSPGTGLGFLHRWYFNAQLNQCQQFMYAGAKGNQNNFLTEDECAQTCTPPPQRDEFLHPCNDNGVVGNNRQTFERCSAEFPCKSRFFCHLGATDETTMCCLKRSDQVCDQPVNAGIGDAQLNRWYFDQSTKTCAKFMYKGLRGNENNFLSAEQCRRTCAELNVCADNQQPFMVNGEPMQCATEKCPTNFFCHYGSTARTTVCCPKTNNDPCSLAVAVGLGGGSLSRWYFDSAAQQCHQFQYKGVGGNENNFIRREECDQQCRTVFCPHGTPLVTGTTLQTCTEHKPCPDAFLCHVNTKMGVSVCCPEPEVFCYKNRDPGPCKNHTVRYGYDAQENNCVEFQYGGCAGNLNNFETMEDCTEVCCNGFKRMLVLKV